MVESKVGWGARLFSASIAAGAITLWVRNQTWAQALVMCAMLVVAWHYAFVATPSARLPLREVFEGYRTGRFARQSQTSKLVYLLIVALLILAAIVAR